MKPNSLGRSEKLKSEKSISQLFETGKILSVSPVRLIYQKNSSSPGKFVKSGFAVPKKNFKRAVDRNLLKRRMREAYRVSKHILYTIHPEFLSGMEIMLIYQGRQIEEFEKIQNSISGLLKKLQQKIDAGR